MDGRSQSSNECSRCRRLEAELEAQRAQLKKLQELLDEQQRKRKRQAAPFRRSKKAEAPPTDAPAQRKKPGRKPGHEPAQRARPEHVDHTIDVPVARCPDCGVRLKNKRTFEQFQTDLPPVRPVVTQFNVEVGDCPCCGKRVQGTHPDQTSQALGAAGNALGPRALGLAADLKYRLGIPFRKISDLFGGFFSLPFSPGGMAQAASRLARRGRPVYEFIKLRLSLASVVHADETSWYLNGSAWLHVFTDGTLVAFVVDPSRSRAVALGVLGESFEGLVVCDGSPIYDVFRTARCNAHPLARIERLLEADVAGTRGALVELRELLKSGLSLRERREELTALGFRRQCTVLRRELPHWSERFQDASDEEVARLARHLIKYRSEFLRYLDDPKIPATNNTAEGTLRFAVPLRKIGCGNRAPSGARTFETLSSISATMRRMGVDFLDWVSKLLHVDHPKLIPPELLPSGCPFQIPFSVR
jgi:transposase